MDRSSISKIIYHLYKEITFIDEKPSLFMRKNQSLDVFKHIFSVPVLNMMPSEDKV